MTNTISIDQLYSKVASDIQSLVEGEVKSYCEKVLREHIMNTVYSSGGTDYYPRTYEFLNAVEVTDVKRFGGNISFRIVINASKMGSHQNPKPLLNAHMGLSGQDWTPYMAETLNDGASSGALPAKKGYHFFERATGELDGDLAGVLARGLRGRGWDATVI